MAFLCQAAPAARPARFHQAHTYIVDAAPAPGEKTRSTCRCRPHAAHLLSADSTALQQMPADNADPDTTSAFAPGKPGRSFALSLNPFRASQKRTSPAEGIPRTRVILLSALVTSLVVGCNLCYHAPVGPQATGQSRKG